ncbi:MAG TPA: hypothetical protein VIO33_07445 [Burkholderiaceae bacterium]
MKIEDLASPGLIVLGVVAIGATALLGVAVGIAAGRDPKALTDTARRAMRETARGIERVALWGAQAREHVADLWAEAREEALAEVDAADFARAARRGKTAGNGAEPKKPGARRPAAKRRRKSASAETPQH